MLSSSPSPLPPLSLLSLLLLPLFFLLLSLSPLPASAQSSCPYTNVSTASFGRVVPSDQFVYFSSNLLSLTNLTTAIPLTTRVNGGNITSLAVYLGSFGPSAGAFRMALYTQLMGGNITLLASTSPVTVPGNRNFSVITLPVTPPVFLPPNPATVWLGVWFADSYLYGPSDVFQVDSAASVTTNYSYNATGVFPPLVAASTLNPIGLLRFTLQVQFTVLTNSTCNVVSSSTGAAGRVLGDPQFTGFLGQRYQVHGVDGYVYNLISAASLQLNARFTFLQSGRCPTVSGVVASDSCWSHPGSYLGELGLQLLVDGQLHRLLLVSGGAEQGFLQVQWDGVDVSVGASGSVGDHVSDDEVSWLRVSSHELRVTTPLFSFTFANSDRFINQQVQLRVPTHTLSTHGLLGQTHRRPRGASAAAVQGHRATRDVLEGDVDDYTLTEQHVFGTDFRFNQFHV